MTVKCTYTLQFMRFNCKSILLSEIGNRTTFTSFGCLLYFIIPFLKVASFCKGHLVIINRDTETYFNEKLSMAQKLQYKTGIMRITRMNGTINTKKYR